MIYFNQLYIVCLQLGKCESGFQFNDEVMAREKELKCYFEKKINNLIFTNKELSSQSNAYAMEVSSCILLFCLYANHSF